MTKVRIAAVGTGYFSRFQYAAWNRIKEAEVVAVCNRTRAGAQEVASKFGIKQVFDDFAEMLDVTTPDLVDIITPPATHLAYITEAANRGVNVICQKPFCETLNDAIKAVEIAEKANITLVIHENFRFQPWYSKIFDEISGSRLGELYQAQFRLRPGDGQGPDAYLARQPYFQKMPRFLIHETGVHWIDTFRYLFGEITSVNAVLRRLNPAIAGEDSGLVTMAFESGLLAVFDGNRLSDHSAENRRLTMGEMTIEGSAGALSLDGDANIMMRSFGQNQAEKCEYQWDNIDFGGDCVYRLQRHVINYITGKGTLMNSGREYLRNLAVEEAIYRAADENRTVVVDYSKVI